MQCPGTPADTRVPTAAHGRPETARRSTEGSTTMATEGAQLSITARNSKITEMDSATLRRDGNLHVDLRRCWTDRWNPRLDLAAEDIWVAGDVAAAGDIGEMIAETAGGTETLILGSARHIEMSEAENGSEIGEIVTVIPGRLSTAFAVGDRHRQLEGVGRLWEEISATPVIRRWASTLNELAVDQEMGHCLQGLLTRTRLLQLLLLVIVGYTVGVIGVGAVVGATMTADGEAGEEAFMMIGTGLAPGAGPTTVVAGAVNETTATE